MIPGIKKRGINFTDLLMYLAIAMKHLRLMVLAVCVSLLSGLVYYVYAKPLYYSRSLVRYKSLPLPVDTEKIYRDSNDREILSQLTAPHIISRTAKKLGVSANVKDIDRNYLRRVMANFNSERNIEIEIFTYTPEGARVWTETMVREFLLNREEQRAAHRESVIKGYTQEMARLNEEMKKALGTKFDLEQTNEFTKIMLEMDQLKDVPHQLYVVNMNLGEMERVRAFLTDTNRDTITRLSLIAHVERILDISIGQMVSGLESEMPSAAAAGRAKQPQIIVVPSMISAVGSKSWEDMEKDQIRLRHLAQERSRTFLAGHPKMKEVTEELDKVNRALDGDLSAALNRFNLKYADLLNKKRELEEKLPAYQENLRRQERYQHEFDLFKQSQLTWEKFYTDMAKELKTLDFGGEKERVQLQYLGLAELRDEKPVSPHRLKLVIYSLALGLALAIGLPFLLEFLDHTVSNVEDIEFNFQLRGLGIVPKIENPNLESQPLIGGDNKIDRHLLENFRVIRTNLVAHGMVTKMPHVIMVASAMPQEGKTVVSTNLALSFAHMGEKTLLIDADLRRGRLHRVFGCKSKPGLSNLLVEKGSVEEACRPTAQENLTLVPCGEHLDGATELLGSPAFSRLMDDLRQKYQRIIIDTPPVLGLSETSMMQTLVDGVVFVIWSGHTPLRSVKTAIDILHANHANFYGFVLNRLDLSATTNYYHYYYYSSYYYKSYQALEKV
jgi:capsular exopolysaccharide synthesis family protein